MNLQQVLDENIFHQQNASMVEWQTEVKCNSNLRMKCRGITALTASPCSAVYGMRTCTLARCVDEHVHACVDCRGWYECGRRISTSSERAVCVAIHSEMNDSQFTHKTRHELAFLFLMQVAFLDAIAVWWKTQNFEPSAEKRGWAGGDKNRGSKPSTLAFLLDRITPRYFAISALVIQHPTTSPQAIDPPAFDSVILLKSKEQQGGRWNPTHRRPWRNFCPHSIFAD